MYTNLVRTVASVAIVFSIVLIFIFNANGDVEKAEPYIEFINLILITAVLFIGLSILPKIGDVLKSAIISINVVLSLFWLKECISVANAFNVISVSGSVVDFIELLMIGSLLLAINKLRTLI